MKFTKATLTISFALLAISSKAASFNGCVIGGQGECQACYEREVLGNEAGCDSRLPASDNCAIYGYKNYKSRCVVCKAGRSLKKVVRPGLKGPIIYYECNPGTISKCVDQTADPNACGGCSNGLYVVDGRCQSVPNPIRNCLWGGAWSRGSVRCYRCADGYAVSFDGRKCEAPSSPGCWINSGNGACFACNPYEGYSSTGHGGCYRG